MGKIKRFMVASCYCQDPGSASGGLAAPEQVLDEIDPVTQLGDHEQHPALDLGDLFWIDRIIGVTLGGDQPVLDADHPVNDGTKWGGEQDHIAGFDEHVLLLEHHCQVTWLVGGSHGTREQVDKAEGQQSQLAEQDE